MKLRSQFLPMCRPSLGSEEKEAVARVLDSQWITSGPETVGLEKDFAEYVGASHAIAVTSATSGLYMILRALGIGEGDEVIVPSLTWPATANVVELCGATPVFCDVDYRSVCVTREMIEASLTPRTKAVLLVHFAGLACDIDPILKLAGERNLILVEDAAHAAGTSYKGKMIGAPHSSAACFSFHPIKNMTCGEGGLITCADADLRKRLTLERFHGVSRDAWQRYGDRSLPYYDVEFPALKFNIPDILSAIARVQVTKLAGFNSRRRMLASHYLEALADVEEIDLPARTRSPEEHSWHLFAIKLNARAKLSREEMMVELHKRQVGTGLHFLPVHTMSHYRTKYPGLSLANSETIGRNIMSLPLFPRMSEEDVKYVCTALKDALSKGKMVSGGAQHETT